MVTTKMNWSSSNCDFLPKWIKFGPDQFILVVTISFWSWPNHYGQVQINLVRPKPFWTNQNCFGYIEGQGISFLPIFSSRRRKSQLWNPMIFPRFTSPRKTCSKAQELSTFLLWSLGYRENHIVWRNFLKETWSLNFPLEDKKFIVFFITFVSRIASMNAHSSSTSSLVTSSSSETHWNQLHNYN